MSQDDPKLDALEGLDDQKRATLTRLITGTSFVAPVVVSFAMQGLSVSTAEAITSNSSGLSGGISDVRLKTDLVRVGSHPAGFGIYRFRYVGSDVEYLGVLAQEVLEKVPEAVSASPRGILSVDYPALGLEMKRYDA